MATYYDGLNGFHELIEKKRPPVSAQLLGLHLLHLNNRSGNTGTVQISDRELELRTRLRDCGQKVIEYFWGEIKWRMN